MLKSKKNVFWEALLLTVVIFFLGILIGIGFEMSRTEKIEDYYSQSEISLIDMQAMQDLTGSKDLNCDVLRASYFDFADRIYNEAKILDNYDDSGKVTESIKLTHKKYDILRTLLWINSIEGQKKCGEDFSVVVYLYEYEPEDLAKKATQGVWSKVLGDLKEKRGKEFILIPIAYTEEIITLNALRSELEVDKLPIVIINDNVFLKELNSVEELGGYLN